MSSGISPGGLASNGDPAAEAPDRPEPEFEVLGVKPVEATAGPELEFEVRISDASMRAVHVAALTAVIEIEAAHRSYDDGERERLGELFGVGSGWDASAVNIRLARAGALVHSFTGEGRFTISVPCGYDLEVASTKYVYSLSEGEVPLRLHFNGTVFYRDEGGGLQIVPVPWDRSIRFRMPVESWRAAIEAHYPHAGWVAVEHETLERLRTYKVDSGQPSFSAAIEALLAGRGGEG